ncbi:hypothetical protein D9M69_625870 [compost metagenome]
MGEVVEELRAGALAARRRIRGEHAVVMGHQHVAHVHAFQAMVAHLAQGQGLDELRREHGIALQTLTHQEPC